MGDQSRSTHFRTLFESALQAYKEKTGITLIEHPLAVQLQSCFSVESITAVLQDQIQGSSDFGGIERVMKSINSIMSITSTLSATAILDWANGLVRLMALMTCSTSLTRFFQTFSPENAIHAGIAILLAVCVSRQLLRAYRRDIHVCQEANGVDDALIVLLESIERILTRLAIYTQIPHTSALSEMVVKIMMELVSTITLATKELKLGRSSESVLVDALRYSTECSKIHKETVRREGRRVSITKAGPTHTR